jgi:catechol 2,3-dioxygenase-like lactoylglutathione lyase family enzyme
MKLEFHHINYASKDIEELYVFYQNIMQMDAISPKKFPRTTATDKAGYDGKIKFVTEGTMQMHLAEQDLTIANKHNQEINPVEKGHIAFRTDDIEEFKARLREKNIPFSDYGTTFAKEWYQIFFHDPVGNVIEVHQLIG